MASLAGVQIMQINSKEILQGQVSLIVFAVSQLLLHARCQLLTTHQQRARPLTDDVLLRNFAIYMLITGNYR